MASGTRLVSSSIWTSNRETERQRRKNSKMKQTKKKQRLCHLHHRMRSTDLLFHTPVCRYLHFHDFAGAQFFLGLRNIKVKGDPAFKMKTKAVQRRRRRRLNVPPHSSMRLAIVSASSSAIFRMLLRPSRTTCTTWASLTVSRLQNGGITCISIRWATCGTTHFRRGISLCKRRTHLYALSTCIMGNYNMYWLFQTHRCI